MLSLVSSHDFFSYSTVQLIQLTMSAFEHTINIQYLILSQGFVIFLKHSAVIKSPLYKTEDTDTLWCIWYITKRC